MRIEALESVLLEQRQQAALADGAGSHLGAHVVLHDIEANVGEDQVPDVLAQLAALVDLDRRDAQRLLPDLGRVRVVAAGDRAADVGLVSLGRRPGDQLVFEEDRLEDGDVVVLVAQREDVVVEDDVAGVDVAVEIVGDVLADRASENARIGRFSVCSSMRPSAS